VTTLASFALTLGRRLRMAGRGVCMVPPGEGGTCQARVSVGAVQTEKQRTHAALAADARTPRGRPVDDAKVGADAVRARGGFGLEVLGVRLGALDLYEAFGADRLVAAARVVDVGWVVLTPPMVSGGGGRGAQEAGAYEEAYRALDRAPVERGLVQARALLLLPGRAPALVVDAARRGRGRRHVRLAAVLVRGRRRRRAAVGEDGRVVPRVLVVLERPVERREPAVRDELADDLLVPVARAGVDALRHERAKVDGLVVRAPPRRGAVAHLSRARAGEPAGQVSGARCKHESSRTYTASPHPPPIQAGP
jgi:hypothetical protein